MSLQKAISTYTNNLEKLKVDCSNLAVSDLLELFKGMIVTFIKELMTTYNKLLQKMPELRYSKSSDKISNLNILLECLEGSGILFGVNCVDLILRGYTNHIYMKYRDDMMQWEIEKIKGINSSAIEQEVFKTATVENVDLTESGEYLDLIPEIVLMMNNLKEKEILKILYVLNNINVIIDIYLFKQYS